MSCKMIWLLNVMSRKLILSNFTVLELVILTRSENCNRAGWNEFLKDNPPFECIALPVSQFAPFPLMFPTKKLWSMRTCPF